MHRPNDHVAPRKEVKHHDVFNLIVLPVICGIDISYLCMATGWSNFGTGKLGLEHRYLSYILLGSFSIYLVVDLIWVTLIPKSVVRNPVAIIGHHLMCLLLLLIPWIDIQLSWYMAANVLVEVNTVLFTLRRNLQMRSFSHHIVNILFYVTWVLLRLVMFPSLVVLLFSEYLRYSRIHDSVCYLYFAAFLGQILITSLSLWWTFEMLCKLLRGKVTRKD